MLKKIRRGDAGDDSQAKERSGFCENPECEHRIYKYMGKNVSWIVFVFIIAGVAWTGIYLDGKSSKSLELMDKRITIIETVQKDQNTTIIANQKEIIDDLSLLKNNAVLVRTTKQNTFNNFLDKMTREAK